MSLFSTMFRRLAAHKVLTAFVIIVVGSGAYLLVKKSSATATETRYVLSEVSKGTLIASVSGTGQVSVSNQVDVKPKASGDVIAVSVVQGQYVTAGQMIAQLDTAEAQKSVRDAEVSLQSTQLSFDKAKQSSADLETITQNAFADLSNAFLDFPAIVSGSADIILGSTINTRSQDNASYYKDYVGQLDYQNYLKVSGLADLATKDVKAAQSSYEEALSIYKNTDRSADSVLAQNLLTKALSATQKLAQALKSEQNLIDYLFDYQLTYNRPPLPALVTTYKNNIRTYLGQVNNHLSSLTSARNNIENVPLDIKSQELSLMQRQNALQDAKDALAHYYIRAPFSGIVAKLNVKRGDSVSSGTAVATVITTQKIAQISLNEVDIAKVSLGQKATLTFDAVPDLTITGSVNLIDSLGTASQGVVTYVVTIVFDTQDTRIKPGMSVSASVITSAKHDILLIPNSAVKATGGTNYVELFESSEGVPSSTALTGQGVVSPVLPTRQSIEIGLSNDTMTEVVGGLTEGEVIVARTIAGSATTAATTNSSAFRLPGIGGATGGAVRVIGR